jgi:hypothetical protein
MSTEASPSATATYNLPIIFGELDTVTDFTNYLTAKMEAVKKYHLLSYCGEEDLLAHYLFNFDRKHNRHFIGVLESTVAECVDPATEFECTWVIRSFPTG